MLDFLFGLASGIANVFGAFGSIYTGVVSSIANGLYGTNDDYGYYYDDDYYDYDYDYYYGYDDYYDYYDYDYYGQSDYDSTPAVPVDPLAGNDSIAGGDGADSPNGGAGNDSIAGGEGRDYLLGGDGNDTLDGGGFLGDDTLSGGEGSDTYIVRLAGPVPATGAVNAGVIDYGSPWDTDTLVVSGAFEHAPFTFNLLVTRMLASMGIGSSQPEISNLKLGESIESLDMTGVGDPIDATGNWRDNWITGNAFRNELAGDGGDDFLSGKSGADRLLGGGGSDYLVGGDGADRFVFDTYAGLSSNVDTISDFELGVDQIVLDRSAYGALPAEGVTEVAFADAASSATAETRILYDSSTGDLFYDPDGSGGAAAIKFAVMLGAPELTAADFLVVS